MGSCSPYYDADYDYIYSLSRVGRQYVGRAGAISRSTTLIGGPLYRLCDHAREMMSAADNKPLPSDQAQRLRLLGVDGWTALCFIILTRVRSIDAPWRPRSLLFLLRTPILVAAVPGTSRDALVRGVTAVA